MNPLPQSLNRTSFSRTDIRASSTTSTPSPGKRRQMADVMQPLVQPSSSMGMLQPRSQNSPDTFQSTDPSPSYQQPKRQPQAPRSTSQNVGQYRATASAPVQPYAFQSTPHLRQNSAPAAATQNSNPASVQSSSSSAASSVQMQQSARRNKSKEDVNNMQRPQSVISLSQSIPDLTLNTFDGALKNSPDRYRRASSKKAEATVSQSFHSPSAAVPSGSGMSAVEHLYIPPPTPPAVQRAVSDDAQNAKASEAAKRYRRRSTANFDNTNTGNTATAASALSYAQVLQRPSTSHVPQVTSASKPTDSSPRPASSHSRTNSNEQSKTPAPPLSTLDTGVSSANKSSPPAAKSATRKETSPVRSPARSNDAQKRVNHPSPLSRSNNLNENAASKAQEPTSPPKSPSKPSPAAQQLAALSDKDLNKGMKSRLRRAFSFGSAAELRKASGGSRPSNENATTTVPKPADRFADEYDAEQQEIIRKQEEAGIGAGIYSGQGGFSGSTDNISVSSTASSASVMLRKMGQGMKKGGRSLKGLFRPKSVIGVPAADSPIQPSVAEVSMVTVEAERQRVNINATVSEQNGGGTGFPKLERNSMEIPLPGVEARSSSERNDSLRKSIVGSDKERAEVLAAVKKGILKRSGTGSPQGSPVIRAQNASFTDIPSTASPAGSVPGTPKDERKSRSLSSTNSSNDYFSPRLNVNTRSMPATPQSARNISFSPRIQFHDVWSSTEYDRRGEIATCNRLTPMLAQQIKEELNTFKMEMEVHELSKPHTHFF